MWIRSLLPAPVNAIKFCTLCLPTWRPDNHPQTLNWVFLVTLRHDQWAQITQCLMVTQPGVRPSQFTSSSRTNQMIVWVFNTAELSKRCREPAWVPGYRDNRRLFWTYCRRWCRRQIPPASWGCWPANWQSRRSSQTPAGPGWAVTWSPPPCADLETDTALQCTCANVDSRATFSTHREGASLPPTGQTCPPWRKGSPSSDWHLKMLRGKRSGQAEDEPNTCDIWEAASEHVAACRQAWTLAVGRNKLDAWASWDLQSAQPWNRLLQLLENRNLISCSVTCEAMVSNKF